MSKKKKLTIVRKKISEKIHDKTYYKIEAEIDPEKGTLKFETTTYSWGHADWEDIDKISFPYRSSSTYGSNPCVACFKTEHESRIPVDIELQLTMAILENVKDHISCMEEKIRNVTEVKERYENVHTMLSNEPLVLGKKLGIL